LGEGDHPPPPLPRTTLLHKWARPVPAAPPPRPWGQKRQKPGFAPPAYQARGVGWPHQKQPQTGQAKNNKSVANGQRWRTGPTPTRTPTNVARGVAAYDGQPSLTQQPPWRMQPQQPPNTHPYRYPRKAQQCKFGLNCLYKDLYCEYQHPSPMAQAQRGEWAQVQRTVRCWFGDKCSYAFCPYQHSGWFTRQVSKGVNTERGNREPHHAGRLADQNYFKILQKQNSRIGQKYALGDTGYRAPMRTPVSLSETANSGFRRDLKFGQNPKLTKKKKNGRRRNTAPGQGETTSLSAQQGGGSGRKRHCLPTGAEGARIFFGDVFSHAILCPFA